MTQITKALFRTVVQSLSRIQLFVTLWTAAHQASLFFTISWNLFKLMSIDDVIQPSRPLSSPSPPIFNLSSIRVFSTGSVLHIRWPQYWSFIISPSNEYSGLISFRIDRFDLLAVQGTLKTLLQHHKLKAPILWHSAFFMLQLSHPYMIMKKS